MGDLIYLFGVILAIYCLYNLLCIFLKVPDSSQIKNINKVILKDKVDNKLNYMLDNWGMFLAKYIKIPKLKRDELEKSLNLLNMEYTPETFVGNKIAGGIFCFSFCFVVYILHGSPVFIILGVVFLILYPFNGINSLNAEIIKKTGIIDDEMLAFASTIEQELKHTRNVIDIFMTYKKMAGTYFKREIEIALGDMSSGNINRALLKLESRNNSVNLSEVLRGLQSVLNGDNNIIYFQNLVMKFQEKALTKKRVEIEKLPTKMMTPIYVIFLGFILYLMSALMHGLFSALG